MSIIWFQNICFHLGVFVFFVLNYLHHSNKIHLFQYLHNSLRFTFTFFYFPFPYDTPQPSFAHNTHFIGLPTGLRSQIRNSNKGNWYKEMYNTMHRNQGRSKKMHYILTCYTYAVFDFIFGFELCVQFTNFEKCKHQT